VSSAPTSPNESSRPPRSWGEVEVGSFVLMTKDRMVSLLNTVGYEVGDGDLFLYSRSGNVLQIPRGQWLGIGTLERTEGGSWVAIERFV
jgi:hypothetical protein